MSLSDSSVIVMMKHSSHGYILLMGNGIHQAKGKRKKKVKTLGTILTFKVGNINVTHTERRKHGVCVWMVTVAKVQFVHSGICNTVEICAEVIASCTKPCVDFLLKHGVCLNPENIIHPKNPDV